MTLVDSATRPHTMYSLQLLIDIIFFILAGQKLIVIFIRLNAFILLGPIMIICFVGSRAHERRGHHSSHVSVVLAIFVCILGSQRSHVLPISILLLILFVVTIVVRSGTIAENLVFIGVHPFSLFQFVIEVMGLISRRPNTISQIITYILYRYHRWLELLKWRDLFRFRLRNSGR